HGGDRKSAKAKSKSQIENLKSFTEDTAAKTGKGRSTIARDVTRANKVKVLDQVIGTSLDQGAELDALGELPEDEQRKLAARAQTGEKVSAKLVSAPTAPASTPAHDDGPGPASSGELARLSERTQELENQVRRLEKINSTLIAREMAD